jgi:hypothetical protein
VAVSSNQTQAVPGIHLKSDVGEKLTRKIRLGKLVDLNHDGFSLEDKIKLIKRLARKVNKFINLNLALCRNPFGYATLNMRAGFGWPLAPTAECSAELEHGVVKLSVVKLVPNKRVERECSSSHPKSRPASAWTGTYFIFEIVDADNVVSSGSKRNQVRGFLPREL